MWGFGCDPSLDDKWKNLDCKVLIEFSIDGQNFRVGRYGNSMFLSKENEEFIRFPKITGDYSKSFSDLVKFRPLLPNKTNKNVLETPPPAYYFLPFYVDQRRGWTKLWDSFENLQQYSNWHKTVINYHTGYLSPEFFEIEEKITAHRFEKSNILDEVKKIETALDVVAQYAPKDNPVVALTQHELINITGEIEVELRDLQSDQESKLQKMAELNLEHQYLKSQLELTRAAARELELDYVFTVERIDGEEIQCPLCGTTHDSSLASRASILADKDAALIQASNLEQKLERAKSALIGLKNELADISKKIDAINEKYNKSPNESNNYPSIVDCLAARSIERLVLQSKNEKNLRTNEIKKVERKLKKEQKELLDKETKETLDSDFKDRISRYVEQLKATGVNLSNVSSPLDYKKLLGGGAAESTRGVLAYLMATIQQIYNSQNEVFAPFIVDTPNQQEQADFNYARIIKFLLEETPSKAQIFLCAMNSDLLSSYKEKSKVIELDENKLLTKEKYEWISPSFDFLTFESKQPS
jgi:hypothetical protein